WFGTDNGLSCFDGSTWKTYQATSEQQTLASNNIHDIAFEVSHYGPELWLATDNGVSVVGISIDAITCATPYRKENRPLISNMVHAVAVDSAHIRWFGTDAGLSSFTGSDWMSYTTTTEVSLSHNYVLSISASKDGWKYIGTKGGGVSRIFNNGIDTITSASPYDYAWSGLLSDSVYAAYVLEDGTQWFGTDKGAAYHDTTATKFGWDTFTTDSGLVHNFVQAIARDKNGVIWFGTKGGVSSYDGQTWESFTTTNGLSGNNVYDIAVDIDGSLWFATDNGVTHYSGNIVAVESDAGKPEKVAGFILQQNYPNPFNATTVIRYALPFDSRVMVKIFDLLGKEVAVLEKDEIKPAGWHSVTWDGQDQYGRPSPSGIYFYQLMAGDFFQTRKILLVR
ncbi:MAG: T9SS type A sorting domain-containing protein, partial [candidate division KSB1 bacterium]|nr:T9SS type A sorting domain-containing protein [candidate division KSB1 bacterium]